MCEEGSSIVQTTTSVVAKRQPRSHPTSNAVQQVVSGRDMPVFWRQPVKHATSTIGYCLLINSTNLQVVVMHLGFL